MTRDEHLAWAKERALAELDGGNRSSAIASIISDLHQHEELQRHAGLELGGMLMLGGHFDSERAIREWITGFN